MKKIGSCLWKLIEKIVVGCLRLLYIALHKELTEDAIDGFMQFVKFGLVGVSNTVVNYVIYAGALLFLAEKSSVESVRLSDRYRYWICVKRTVVVFLEQ